MPALLQDYQIQWNGLLMGTGTAFDLVGINGAGIPSVRSNDINRLDDHGTFPARRELLNGRTFNFEVDIVATDIADLHSKVNAFRSACIPSEAIRELFIRIAGTGWGESSDDTVIAYGFARQMTANIGALSNANIQKAYLQIEVPDPRMYSELENSEAVGPTVVGGGGWTFPWTFPWTFGTSSGGTVSITNTGPFTTPPTMIVNGPATNPRIQNLDTGEFIQLDFAILTGETLVLNFRDQTALLNGTTDRWNFRKFGSTWFPLRPGLNPFQYTLAAGNGQLEIRWRNAWL